MVLIHMTPELEARRAKVRLLLESLDDYLPTTRGVDMGDIPGPAPSSQVPCDYCKVTPGRITRWWGGEKVRVPCPVCLGEGWRRRRADEPEWDRYVECPIEEVRTTRTGTHDPWAEEQRLTASIERIQRTLDAKAGKEPEEYVWLEKRRWLEKHGSYKELKAWLGALEIAYPEMRAAIRRMYEYGLPVTDRRTLELEDMGVSWLAHAMLGEIRVPPWITEPVAHKRTQSIEELAEQGLGAGAIARKLGLPKRKVRKTLERLRRRKQ